jgi:DNA modification methylase
VIDDCKPKDFRKMTKAELQRAAEEMYFKLNNVPTTVVRHDKITESEDHPTMKPVNICGRFIMNSSRPGECVLDPFGGSGSTLIACDQIRRKARIIELEPKFCDATLRRWEKASRKTAELIHREASQQS